MATATPKFAPRSVTDEERRFFADNGWVKLDGFLREADAVALRERLEARMGRDAAKAQHPAGESRGDGYESSWHTFAPVSIENRTGTPADELFYDFSHSPEMGATGAALLGGSVRYWIDQSLVKMPAGVDGSGETMWHSDIGGVANSPFNPPRQVQVWMALTDITPALGSLRFVAPKDTNDDVRALIKELGVEGSYPELERRGILSPALHMKAGDATVHGSATLHSAPPNKTDRIRWAYITSMFPADAVFTGNSFWPCEGVKGVVKGEPFPDHRFPVLA
jgi:Phytanoyl-CoA dioxygenase (PhyH)